MSENEQNFPLFCELCLIKFPSITNAQAHFKGVNHYNKIMLSKRLITENLIWCDICCVELNTQRMLDIHCQSPKHQTKVQAQQEIMQMKLEFLAKQNEPIKVENNL